MIVTGFSRVFVINENIFDGNCIMAVSRRGRGAKKRKMVDPICGTRFRYINLEAEVGRLVTGWLDVLAVLMAVESGWQGEFHLMIISTVSMMMIPS